MNLSDKIYSYNIYLKNINNNKKEKSTSGTRQHSQRAGRHQPAALAASLKSEIFSYNMEALFGVPFAVLECPNIKLKKPSWLHMPSAMTVYAVVIVSYFLITGGKWSCCCCSGWPFCAQLFHRNVHSSGVTFFLLVKHTVVLFFLSLFKTAFTLL